MKYRAEIDGLRALAVIPVIFFHAGSKLFSGGFIGVDVFFVISGYLITTILIEDIENKRFSILNFYERRARRILPALFFVMLVCIPFAWMWMPPSQMKNFSMSLLAVSLFVSNILFWRESGYFAAAAEEKPLLHTWSLAVEEQYYILFPVFLFLAWRFGKNRVFWMIVIFAALSIMLSEWGWRNKETANFYLAPTRAWELCAGSLAAFVVQKRGVQANNLLSFLGLATIIFAIFAYDETTPFPSVYALVPVIGVVLLVLYAGKETLTAKILSTKAFVGIGLISYSAYLWHQPLFAFARLRLIEGPSLLLMAFLSVMSILLAIISWKYVEKPFRNRHTISSLKVFIYSLTGIAFFSLIGFFGYINNGFEKANIFKHKKILDEKIYVIGDSHALHLVSGLQALNAQVVVAMTSAGCIPFRNVDRFDSRFEVGACAKTINQHLDDLSNVDNQAIVILSTMGPVYLDGTTFMGKDQARITGLGVNLITDLSITDHYKVFEIGMRQTLEELQKNANLKIAFAIDVPELGIDKGCGVNAKTLRVLGAQISDSTNRIGIPKENCRVSRALYEDRSRIYKALVMRILNDFPEVLLFDPTDFFCDIEFCKGYDENYGFLYRDIDHLSYGGSLYFALMFSDFIAKEINK